MLKRVHSETMCQSMFQNGFTILTMVEEGGGTDLSDGAFEMEPEGVTAPGVHTRTSSVVLQLHPVEVWVTALRTTRRGT